MSSSADLNTNDRRSKLMKGLLLHFFVNMSLAADADDTLAALGMGRPHHRILMVALQAPGITVNEVLEVLHVTHQNIRLPMKKLVDGGYLLVKPGETDRRQRTLSTSAKGRKLVERLLSRQWVRLERTYAEVGDADFQIFLRVQQSLIDPADAVWARRLIGE
ncbi:MarR family winged helix-turn-helix transcriptional regulator [Vineibacter terrae]|uniref:Winged helix-turn-helix transcriptional regulator n=1 Tax=Vineibacter terrae TaxID=2586908 RepID=A0A5C8PEP5_9HYPH|nr:MarR family winged helix-turn-helix transcriptional regulator [Vineibacter terrae]TXL71624.1 winged helix-turn-helix transcriptional regulator [Vineibacter terrae]HEX2892328.1 MarR family winged helix-turn-helix transcriptional regulator [Vineibacter terrae]